MVEKLNQAEMCSLKGGVTVEEYCRTLGTIIANNGTSDSARDAWNKYCA